MNNLAFFNRKRNEFANITIHLSNHKNYDLTLICCLNTLFFSSSHPHTNMAELRFKGYQVMSLFDSVTLKTKNLAQYQLFFIIFKFPPCILNPQGALYWHQVHHYLSPQLAKNDGFNTNISLFNNFYMSFLAHP